MEIKLVAIPGAWSPDSRSDSVGGELEAGEHIKSQSAVPEQSMISIGCWLDAIWEQSSGGFMSQLSTVLGHSLQVDA